MPPFSFQTGIFYQKAWPEDDVVGGVCKPNAPKNLGFPYTREPEQ
jgi:hypothetical protein